MSVTDANGGVTNTEYDKLGRAIRAVTPFDDTANGETKTYYDKNSNVVKTSVKRSADKYQTEEYRYDNMGNNIAVIANDGKTDIVTQYAYDLAGRMTEMVTGLSEYSETPSGGAVTKYEYGNDGYLYSTEDPMGNTEYYFDYDNAGNIMEKSDKNGNSIRYIYNSFGLEKTYVIGKPENKEYTYNKLGQLIGTKSVNANEESVEESYEYDLLGRVIKSVSNDGSVQKYANMMKIQILPNTSL